MNTAALIATVFLAYFGGGAAAYDELMPGSHAARATSGICGALTGLCFLWLFFVLNGGPTP